MPDALSLPRLCGQLLVVGFSGTSLPSEVHAWLADGRLGGIIVFKRNLPSLEVAHALNHETVAVSQPDLPPFIAVDQEGGRVARLPSPFLKLPQNSGDILLVPFDNPAVFAIHHVIFNAVQVADQHR